MCFGGKPSAPAPPVINPAPVAPAIVAPIEADVSASAAGLEERRRRKAASGRSDTILTGGLGLPSGPITGGKKLLGE